MTRQEMLEWYRNYRSDKNCKDYRLSTITFETTRRRILSSLYMDLAQGILSRNSLQELRARNAISDFEFKTRKENKS